MCVNQFSLKKVTSSLEVAVNKNRGKALSDSGLGLSMRKSRRPKTILGMVTLRNLIRLTGISLSYWSPHIYDQVALWLKSCVQDFSQENTGTVLPKEVYKAQGPNFKRLKNRKNLRTTGFNLCNNYYCYRGKRSVHSTKCVKEVMQVNKLFVNFARPFSTNPHSNNLNEWVLASKLKQMVEKSKNKDGRYGNLIKIIGFFPTIRFAYLMVKSNPRISTKRIDRISSKTLQKISQDTLSCAIRFSPVRRVHLCKLGKIVLRPLGMSNPEEGIVQKAMEIVLTAIFEEISLDCSHGYSHGRNCHAVLKHLQHKIGNASTYSWVIDGGINGCFDNIPHNMILKGLKRRIDCVSTITFVKRILNAGYVLNEDLKKVGKKNAKVFKTGIGIPQGTILTPLLSNILLHELDKFINEKLETEFTKGNKRKANVGYCKVRYQIKSETDFKKRRILTHKCRRLPSKNFHYWVFKRLFYVRYAHD
jgi:retron-type reverse transcriptase